MTYLVLYDDRGQCQRVAIANSQYELRQFVDAGFVEVDKQEYDRCAALVEGASLRDLAAIVAAGTAISSIAARQRRQQRLFEPPRTDLERVQRSLDQQMADITQRYLSNEINIDQWQRQMQDRINAGNIAARTLGVNGQNNLSADDIRAIERANETQARYLNRFRRELESEERVMTDKQVLSRARQYSQSNGALFEDGYTTAVLGVRLPYQPKVKTCCGVYCKCHWEVRHIGGNDFDCYWRLAAAEHCETCRTRARVLSPLQVRNGVIQPFNPSGLEDAPYSC